MCEIVVTPGYEDRFGNDDDNGIEEYVEHLIDGAKLLYKTNSDGIGFLPVKRADGDFYYPYYKAANPDWDDAREWLENTVENAWRVVIHARLGTGGGKVTQNCHPIQVECPECDDIEHVIHNGVVSEYNSRRNLKAAGHEYNTEVDSETIAHSIGSMPAEIGADTDFEEPDSLTGTLHYLLFSRDGILVRTSGKYEVNEDFTMTCRGNWGADDPDHSDGGIFLFTPDGGFQKQECPESVRVRRVKSASTATAATGGRGGYWSGYDSRAGQTADQDDSTDTVDVSHSQMANTGTVATVKPGDPWPSFTGWNNREYYVIDGTAVPKDEVDRGIVAGVPGDDERDAGEQSQWERYEAEAREQQRQVHGQ